MIPLSQFKTLNFAWQGISHCGHLHLSQIMSNGGQERPRRTTGAQEHVVLWFHVRVLSKWFYKQVRKWWTWTFITTLVRESVANSILIRDDTLHRRVEGLTAAHMATANLEKTCVCISVILITWETTNCHGTPVKYHRSLVYLLVVPRHPKNIGQSTKHPKYGGNWNVSITPEPVFRCL